MKNLKNILAALGFVFAIGAAFAFSVPKSTDLMLKPAANQNNSCQPAFVDNACNLGAVGTTCTIIGGSAADIAVQPNPTDCDQAQVFRRPSNP